MLQPYFEEIKTSPEGIRYPFECFITDSQGKNFDILPHWHYYIELLYLLDGTARVFIGGEYFNVSTGDFVLMNSREVHSIHSEEGKYTKYIVIKLDPEVLYTTSKTVFEAKYILPFTMAKVRHQKVFTNGELDGTGIKEIIKEIYEEATNKRYGFELAVRNGVGRLFLWVIRDWEKKGIKLELQSVPREIDIQKLQELFDYLDKNYMEELSVEDMARRCSMSYSYFSRFFKKATGRNFTDYLNYIRVTEAEKLLLTTSMNITEVALSTGFTNSSYFIKQFKHYKNFSPKQFKNRALKE
jgi:AraC family transcriptional regulator, melibiose operon regulatory protein